jgi:DNA-binding NarL/FixJ family response regulator
VVETQALLERDTELAVLRTLVTDLPSNGSSYIVIEGEPGHGRTALLEYVIAHARSAGLSAVFARGTPAEANLSCGVAAQLVAGLENANGTTVADSQARAANTGSLPGLCQAFLSSAREQPLLVAVDDVQWTDPDSQEWLRTILHRLPSLRLILVLTANVGFCPIAETGAVPTHVLRAKPLSTSAVRKVITAACPAGPVTDEFVTEAARASAGNPAILRAMLDHLCLDLSCIDAACLPDLVSEAYRDRVARAIEGLSAELRAVLRAIAVCDGQFDAGLVCSLGGLRRMSVSRALALLAGTGLVVDQPSPRLIDQTTGEWVLAGMDLRDREELHSCAAKLGYRCAIPVDRLARMLLGAAPGLGPWVPQVLRAAAALSRAEAQYQAAARFLLRALREPVEGELRAQLLFELGKIEMGEVPEASERHLGQVLLGETDPQVEPLRLQAADMLMSSGNTEFCRRAFATAYARPTATEAERTGLTALYWLADDAPHDCPELTVPTAPPLPEAPADPAQAAIAAWQAAGRGREPERARKLARAAVARAGDPGSLLSPRIVACRALTLTDDLDEAAEGLDAVLVEARRRGIRSAAGWAMLARTRLALVQGDLEGAVQCLESALDEMPLRCWHPMIQPMVAALDAELSFERGLLDRARRAVESEMQAGVKQGFAWTYLLFARGVVRLVDSQPRWALVHFQECGRRMLARQWGNPALMAWRTVLAKAYRLCGYPREADRLVAEEITLAEQWGAATAVGSAHLGAASALDGTEALRHAAEAVRILRDSPARLRYARALSQLASAMRDTGDGDPEPLVREANELAARQNAALVVCTLEQSGLEYLPVPNDEPDSVLQRLSSAEFRVAELAARGLSNGAIADARKVTKRTIELHLSRAYQKLGISGRPELRAVFAHAGKGL